MFCHFSLNCSPRASALLALLVFLLLLAPTVSHASGDSVFPSTYNTGDLAGQDGWTSMTSSQMHHVINIAGFGNVISRDSDGFNYTISQRTISALPVASSTKIQFVYRTDRKSGTTFEFAIGSSTIASPSYNSTRNQVCGIKFFYDIPNNPTDGDMGLLVKNSVGSSQIVHSVYATSSWAILTMEIDQVNYRCRAYTEGHATSTAWITTVGTPSYLSYYTNMILGMWNYSGSNDINFVSSIIVNPNSSLGVSSSPQYIGDTTHLTDVIQPLHNHSYLGTTSVPFQISYYQSSAYQKADYYKVTLTSVTNNAVGTYYGSLDTTPGSHTLPVRYITGLNSDQYIANVQLYANTATFAFGITQNDYLMDTWHAPLRFNINQDTIAFPTDTGFNPNIDNNLSTTTDNDFAGQAYNFTQNILYNKQPFAWVLQSLQLIKDAALYQQEYEQLQVTVDFLPGVTAATSSGRWVDVYRFKALSQGGLNSYSINFIASGCSAFVINGTDYCDQFRTLSGYMLYLATILFYALLMYKFFINPSRD